MKHGHSCHTTDEFEIGEMILVAEARVGIDLESVIIPDQIIQKAERKKLMFSFFLILFWEQINTNRLGFGSVVFMCFWLKKTWLTRKPQSVNQYF